MTGSEIKLGSAALLVELAALALVFMQAQENAYLYRYFLLHAMACALITPVVWALLPAHYRQPRLVVMLLLFSLCFFIPVLGLLGFYLGVLLSRLWPYLRRREPFSAVALPHYEISKKQHQRNRLRSGQVRSQLASTSAPVELRMKALMSIQHMSPRHSAMILREVLSDREDDLRLLAYGMLDGKEKQIASRIQQARDTLQQADDSMADYAAHKQLAELYWELVYQGLVQGDMRRHALRSVREHVQAALRAQVRDSGLWVISGRCRMLQGDYSGAMGAFSTAVAMGLSRNRAEAYLAELAFLQKHYAEVRQRLHGLAPDNAGQQLALVSSFWGKS